MVLDEAVLGVGRQIIGQVVRTWLGTRRAEADRNFELVDLLAVSVSESFHRRRLYANSRTSAIKPRPG